MTFAINLALLLLGTTAALAAFGGETWKKSDEPLRRRITHRGWLALICMLATLTLGIAKEMRTNAATADSVAKQRKLEDSLARTTEELSETRAKLAAVEPNILQAIVVATSGLRRESDYSTPTIRGQSVQPLLSGRTGRALVLYGGDLVDYHVFCSDAGQRIAVLPSSRRELLPQLILRAGDTEYPLGEQGRQMIIGPVGQPLTAAILNPNGLQGCQLKMLVESADRTREATQLEPLIQMINDAKASAPNR
jgi:hypothetical protein